MDSDAQDRELACQILRRQGYAVDAMTNAEQVLKSVEASLPCLLITKMSARDIEGIGLVTRIRQHIEALMLPILMYTPITRQAQVEALDAGVNDFLTKPIHEIELIARTKSLLAARDAYREIAELRREETVTGSKQWQLNPQRAVLLSVQRTGH